VDGSNCDVAGDLLCDTPADPRLSSSTVTDFPECLYIGGENGPCPGDGPFAPDTSNLMSYSRKRCRDNFTAQQDTRALATLINLRPELKFSDLCLNDPCPWDCTDDGQVGVSDFLSMLAQWGAVGTACDSDGGGVGVTDFLALLAHWGACPE
jgi:hypothetical protein